MRPFWPFWEKWYSWDIVFIVEPVLLIVLTLGLVVPGFFALINQEVGGRSKGLRGRGAAIAALAATVLLWAVRDFEHRKAIHVLEARTYEQADPVRVGAYPTYINPFLWHGVVETRNFFVLAQVNSLGPDVDPDDALQVRYKAEETPITLAAKESCLGRAYLSWARFPITETEPTPNGESIVHYEGDALVVDTTALDDRTRVDGFGTPHTTQLHVIERFHLIEDGNVLEANVHVEDPGAFTMPWDAIQRFRQYEAAVRKVPIERLVQLASALEGPLVEMNCADNPNSFFPGVPALPIPQALAPDF